ncbi:MAG: helix-turn-helix domain-containing protein [Bacteroides sp.]|nr:helix-turn-helix domain-containing protein [Bacteroides sp.]
MNNLRLESAIKILKENPEISISEVAEKCAIPNISTFYRLFKDKYGMTPVEFRDASKNNQ